MSKNIHGFKVGDIIRETVSYTMTLNFFYQVVKATAKTVTLQRIEHETSKGVWSPQGGYVKPIKDKFMVGVGTHRGTFVTKRTNEHQTFNFDPGFGRKVEPNSEHYECHWD